MNHNKIANIFIFLCLAITILFALEVWCDGYIFWGNSAINYNVTGQVGDFLGGVVGTIISAAGFYFLFLTFNEQRRSFEKERLESKFFDLIKLHRDNVSELRFDAGLLVENDDSLHIEKKIYEGKSVFQVIFNQFIICRNDLGTFFKRDLIFTSEYEQLLLNNPYVVKNNIDIVMLAKIDICYSIVFYGVGSEGILILKKIFEKKYKPKFIEGILRFITLKPAFDSDIFAKWHILYKRNTKKKRNLLVNQIYNWRETKTINTSSSDRNVIEGYHNKYIKYYGGHQFRLGHYYRHLYQTVNFINNQTSLHYKEKYDYIKILRAQLSTYEQAALFLNSLSKMGENWELNPEINDLLKNFEKHDFELLTKYNLIKNLPGETIYGIEFKKFFPLITYESDTKIDQKVRPQYR